MASIKKILTAPARVLGAPLKSAKRALDRLIVSRGAKELKFEVQKAVTSMILGSIGRWVYFILVIVMAHAMAIMLGLNVRMVVALAILAGIYGYYVLMTIKVLYFCMGIWKHNGFIWNPLNLMYLYIYDLIITQMEENRFTRYTSYLFFPFRRRHIDHLAKDIIHLGMYDENLWICVGVRFMLYVTGWIIYILCYRNIFLYATGITFHNWYEPLIWPFVMIWQQI